MISKRKFQAYEKVRKSGWTNMLNRANVIVYAKEQSGVNLSYDDVDTTMYQYSELKEKFGGANGK